MTATLSRSARFLTTPRTTTGHSIGVNLAVPILYPKLEKKYGNTVTYEQDPLAHVKTEFGFDVLEVAQGRYAPDAYHDFIGFDVSAPLLEQAFQETYGLELKSVLTDEDKVLGSYRHDVSQLLPKATRIAWSLKKDDIMKDQPGITKSKFLYNLSRASYQKNWGNDFHAADVQGKIPCFPHQDHPEDRSAKSAAAQNAHAADANACSKPASTHRWIATKSFWAKSAPGSPTCRMTILIPAIPPARENTD